MQKVLDKKYLYIGIALGLFLVTIIFVSSLAFKTKKENPDTWVIRSFEDTIVLLNNGEVVEVFGDIMVADLPNEDKLHLEKGIEFLTKDEALLALEDYDG